MPSTESNLWKQSAFGTCISGSQSGLSCLGFSLSQKEAQLRNTGLLSLSPINRFLKKRKDFLSSFATYTAHKKCASFGRHSKQYLGTSYWRLFFFRLFIKKKHRNRDPCNYLVLNSLEVQRLHCSTLLFVLLFISPLNAIAVASTERHAVTPEI